MNIAPLKTISILLSQRVGKFSVPNSTPELAVLAIHWVGPEVSISRRSQSGKRVFESTPQVGDAGDQWKPVFADKSNKPSVAKRMRGTLEGIADAVHNGMLIKVEDLIRAEAFENLLEQADYLPSEGYFLAAGVLGRAILEQHLNNWCHIAGCLPNKPRPTLNDFKHGLCKSKRINITEMKHIESLASVGNDAAHNKPTLTESDVKRLLRDVRDMLVKYALSSV